MLFTKTELKQIRTSFRKTYPDYHNQLKACNTELELKEAYEKIKKDAYTKAKPYLAPGEDPTGFLTIALVPDMLARLKAASGDNMKILIKAMLDTAGALQPDFTVGQTVATLLGSGMTAIGEVASVAFGEGIIGGAVEAVAVAAGVTAVGVAGLVVIIGLIILAVIIPILYFMLKPATCFVLVINETSKTLNWLDDYNVHGQPIGHTPFINKGIYIPPTIDGGGAYVFSGLVQTDKNDAALYGAQYGFTYTYGDTNGGIQKNVNFGVECPLSNIYVDNNCFCAIDSNSEDAANETDDNNVLQYSASSTPLNANIKCNAPDGYVAYYIATIQDGSLK